MNATPSQVVASALAEIGPVILVEGGISFLEPLLENCEIDRLFLTRSPIDGDNDFFDFELLRKNYEIAVSKKLDDITFEEWVPKNHKL
jgi:dihydrofolate reductase